MPVKMAVIGMGGMSGWHHDKIPQARRVMRVIDTVFESAKIGASITCEI